MKTKERYAQIQECLDQSWERHCRGCSDSDSAIAFEQLHGAVMLLFQELMFHEMKQDRNLPESMQQAFNDGKGEYKP